MEHTFTDAKKAPWVHPIFQRINEAWRGTAQRHKKLDKSCYTIIPGEKILPLFIINKQFDGLIYTYPNFFVIYLNVCV